MTEDLRMSVTLYLDDEKYELQTGNYDQNRIIEIYGTTGKI